MLWDTEALIQNSTWSLRVCWLITGSIDNLRNKWWVLSHVDLLVLYPNVRIISTHDVHSPKGRSAVVDYSNSRFSDQRYTKSPNPPKVEMKAPFPSSMFKCLRIWNIQRTNISSAPNLHESLFKIHNLHLGILCFDILKHFYKTMCVVDSY